MDYNLYAAIKLSLLKYDFTQEHTSYHDLFQYSRQFKHGKTFKAFVKICQNMGVRSEVKRVDGKTTRRGLVYDQSQDAYINKEIEVFKPCPTCEGKGIVAAPADDLTDESDTL